MFTSVRILSIFVLISMLAFAHDISGKWTFQVETQLGSGSPTFVFKQSGEKLTGTYNGTFGTAELTGKVTGDDIEFFFEAMIQDQKAKIVYKGKIESPGTMKGTVDFSGLGSGSWTGTKQ
jgi:hypothetical protein